MPTSVRIIPATRTRFNSQPIEAKKKRRVAAYARVSTNEEDQLTSYDAQVSYYSDYIKGKEDWELVEVYADEGISGTHAKNRPGFQRMVQERNRDSGRSITEEFEVRACGNQLQVFLLFYWEESRF